MAGTAGVEEGDNPVTECGIKDDLGCGGGHLGEESKHYWRSGGRQHICESNHWKVPRSHPM